MTQVFFEDFEGGALPGDFDTEVEDGSFATVAINSSSPIEGTYDAVLDVAKTDSDTNFYAELQEALIEPVSLETWVKFKMKVTSFTQAGYATVTSKGPVILLSTTGRMAWLTISDSGSGMALQLAYQGGDGADVQVGSAEALTTNTEYAIKLKIDRSGADPVVEWWIDEVTKGNATDTSVGLVGVKSQTFEWLRVGLCHINQWEKGHYTYQIDNVGLYDSDPDAGGVVIIGPFPTHLPGV